jgi:hypothetical protein
VTDADTSLLDPWDEPPPEIPRRLNEAEDLSPLALSARVGELSLELDRASRVLASRISRATKAKADYQCAHDKRLLAIRVELQGKRSAVDERRALVHEDPEIAQLNLASTLADGLVESARAWVYGLEKQLSAKQSQLRAAVAAETVDPALPGAAQQRADLRAAA